MNVVADIVDVDDVPHELISASKAGPAPKRIVVAFGFWIFLLSDIVMFAVLFAARRMPWAACPRRPDLARGDDGAGRRQRIPPHRTAPPAVFFPVLARARHRLGRRIHCGLSDGSLAMTASNYDEPSGGASASSRMAPPPGVFIYTAGLALAAILTATSFWAANTSLLSAPGVPLGLAVLSIAQMGVHLVFFLHITTGPDNTNNVLALAFGVLIVTLVVGGSLWIMANLNQNMMPMPMHMQH